MGEVNYGLTSNAPSNQVILGRVRPGAGNTWDVIPENQYNEQEKSSEILRQGRDLAQQGVPLQVSNIFDSLAKLRARASGSTAEILPDVIGQLGQLRGQYAGASQAIARRLGFAGGGQTEREQGGALAQATRQYGGIITQQQQAGMASLINMLGGLQPQISGTARPPSVSTRDPGETPGANFNPSIYGKALQSLLNTGRTAYDYYSGPQADARNAGSTIEGFRDQGFTQGLISSPSYTAPSAYSGPPIDEFGYSGLPPGQDYYGY